MMATIDLYRHSGTQMLGTRPAARAIELAIRAASSDGVIALDTSGILRIGVSFFDEALLIFNELIAETGNAELQLIYRNAPQMESLKNLVPNRGLIISNPPSGEWIISRADLD